MYKLADISQFESLANMTSTVVNNRMVVDNGIRDIWQNVTRPIRRSLDGKYTARLLREIQPLPASDVRGYINKVTGYSRGGDSNIYRLGRNIGRITPVGRKNMEAFDIWLRSQDWGLIDKHLGGKRSVMSGLRRSAGKCLNFLAGLNVDVTPIIRTLKLKPWDGVYGSRSGYNGDTNTILLADGDRDILFHEFLHAIYRNGRIKEDFENRGLLDSVIRKHAPMFIKKKLYALYRDNDSIWLYDRRRGKRARNRYAGKVYTELYPKQDAQNAPNTQQSWYKVRDVKQRKIDRWDGTPTNPQSITPTTKEKALLDLLGRRERANEYLSMLPQIMAANKGRLPAGYAKDLLRIIRQINK